MSDVWLCGASTAQIHFKRVLREMPAMIVCPQPLAAEVGLDFLKRGANAVDAAVAVAFCQAVIDPHMCGLGGSGLMLIHAGGDTEAIEFHARAPAKSSPEMWESIYVGESADRYNFVVQGGVNDAGYQSVAVPGSVAGLSLALARHGTLDWADTLKPAIELARSGVAVNGRLRALWTGVSSPDQLPTHKRIQYTPAARDIYTNKGALKELGETLVQSDYARTLEVLAHEGPDAFYTGKIAERIHEDFQAHDGLLTRDDLAAYRAAVTAPIEGSYRGLRIVAPPPPAGGVTLIQMLNFLEGFDISSLRWPSVEAARLRADAMAWAFADRQQWLGDPAFVDVPVPRLIDKGYSERARVRMAEGERFAPAPAVDVPSTTHVSVVDQWGNGVSLTHTLGSFSGVVTEGLGFGYNNYMNCFDPRPGRANSIAPGKTRITMMTPTLIFEGDDLRAIIGAPGGTRIVTAILQSILNVFDHGMSPVEAVSSPRIDFQAGSIQAEGRIPNAVCDGLVNRGYSVNRRLLNYDPYFALAQLLVREPGGRLLGAADPRNDGGSALSVD